MTRLRRALYRGAVTPVFEASTAMPSAPHLSQALAMGATFPLAPAAYSGPAQGVFRTLKQATLAPLCTAEYHESPPSTICSPYR